MNRSIKFFGFRAVIAYGELMLIQSSSFLSFGNHFSSLCSGFGQISGHNLWLSWAWKLYNTIETNAVPINNWVIPDITWVFAEERVGSATPSIVESCCTKRCALRWSATILCRQIIVWKTHKGAAICELPGTRFIIVKQATPHRPCPEKIIEIVSAFDKITRYFRGMYHIHLLFFVRH